MMPMGKPRHKWMVSCVLPSPSTVKCTKGCRRVQSHHRRVRTTNLRGILWPDWLRAVAFPEISRSQRERERERERRRKNVSRVCTFNEYSIHLRLGIVSLLTFPFCIREFLLFFHETFAITRYTFGALRGNTFKGQSRPSVPVLSEKKKKSALLRF